MSKGIFIDFSEQDGWVIKSGLSKFSLKEIDDFFRAWPLLEHSYQDIDSQFAIKFPNLGSNHFPYWKLIGSALKAKSGLWTDRAMSWLPYLQTAEKNALKEFFMEAKDSKWASQKSRQIIRRHMVNINSE